MPDASSRLSTFLGIVLTSEADGEIANAARAAQKLLKAEGLSWNDVAQALEKNGKLLEAARGLKDERDRLAAENERLKRLARGTGPDPWLPAGSPQEQAAWVLELHEHSVLELNHFEEDFLTTISAWEGELRPRQRPVFERLMTKVVRLTSRQPP